MGREAAAIEQDATSSIKGTFLLVANCRAAVTTSVVGTRRLSTMPLVAAREVVLLR
jgi:hypothetical protein